MAVKHRYNKNWKDSVMMDLVAQDLTIEELKALPEDKKQIILDMGVECGRIESELREQYKTASEDERLDILIKAVW